MDVTRLRPAPARQRSCGSCSLCCKIMGVPEVKQRHAWCPHAEPGCECKIYEERPRPCREFNCGWLRDSSLKDYWYPLKSKIVIDVQTDLDIVAFIVDPSYPTRWREEPYFADIKKLARAGLAGFKN